MAVAASLVLAALLAGVSLRALRRTAAGIAWLSLGLGALAAASFGVGSILGGFGGAGLGFAAYAAVLTAVRPKPLREAWAYVRALH